VHEVSVPAPGSIRVRRIVQTLPGHWGPAEFDDLVSVMRQLSAARQRVIVLKKSG
jgi:hypothetical protein